MEARPLRSVAAVHDDARPPTEAGAGTPVRVPRGHTLGRGFGGAPREVGCPQQRQPHRRRRGAGLRWEVQEGEPPVSLRVGARGEAPARVSGVIEAPTGGVSERKKETHDETHHATRAGTTQRQGPGIPIPGRHPHRSPPRPRAPNAATLSPRWKTSRGSAGRAVGCNRRRCLRFQAAPVVAADAGPTSFAIARMKSRV